MISMRLNKKHCLKQHMNDINKLCDGVDDMEDMNRNEIEITTYDRLLRAWENSMELVRDYEMYSKE